MLGTAGQNLPSQKLWPARNLAAKGPDSLVSRRGRLRVGGGAGAVEAGQSLPNFFESITII